MVRHSTLFFSRYFAIPIEKEMNSMDVNTYFIIALPGGLPFVVNFISNINISERFSSAETFYSRFYGESSPIELF